MKKIFALITAHPLRSLVILIVTTAVMLWIFVYTQNDLQNTLSNFAEKKLENPRSLEGILYKGNDTLFYNIIADLNMPLREDTRDVIFFKTEKDTVYFERGMLNDQNVPDPDGHGKYMRHWSYWQTNSHDSTVLQTLKGLINNGKNQYRGIPTAYQLQIEAKCKQKNSVNNDD